MTRWIAILAALAVAPAAQAANFVVNDPGDAGDLTCDDVAPPDCTLRDAIDDANNNAGPDTITFAGLTAVTTLTALPDVTDPVTIGQEQDITVTLGGPGPSLRIAPGADPTALRRIKLVGGAGQLGDLLRIEEQNVTVDRGGASGANNDGIEVATAAARNILISGATISGNNANGVRIGNLTRNTSIRTSSFFNNGAKPIALEGNGNAGAGQLGSLRVGPRQADGTLPLLGNAPASGTIDAYRGNPFSAAPPLLTDSPAVPAGPFSFVFPSEPPAGSLLAFTFTTPGAGTNEFAFATVPNDIVSPDVTFARAISTREVRVRFSEPISGADGNTFALQMASKPRSIIASSLSGDGTELALTSSTGWIEGEAGYITLSSAGAFTDGAGNAALNTNRLRVAAGPGDFTAPLLTKLSLTPKKFCPSGVKNCKGKRGTVIKFDINETGRFVIAAYKGRKQIGNRGFALDKTGPQQIKFSGKLKAGKLSAGRVDLRFTHTDEVGNPSKTVRVPIRVLGKKRKKGTKK